MPKKIQRKKKISKSKVKSKQVMKLARNRPKIVMYKNPVTKTPKSGGMSKDGLGFVLNPQTPNTFYDIAAFRDGKDLGIKVKCCGPVFTCNQTALISGNYNNVASTATTTNNPAPFPGNPAWIMARYGPSAMCDAYARFKIKKWRVYWVGTRTTAADEIVACCYNPDGSAIQGSPTQTYGNILQAIPHTYGPVWKSFNIDLTEHLSQKDWYYTQEGSSASSATRLSSQGVFYIGFNTLVATKTQGILYFDVEIDFIDVLPLGYTSPVSITQKVEEPDDIVVIPDHKEEIKGRSRSRPPK